MQKKCKKTCTIQKKAVPLSSISSINDFVLIRIATLAQLVEQRIRNA